MGKIIKDTIHSNGIDIGIYTQDFENELYIMKDYRRLKADENSRLSLNFLQIMQDYGVNLICVEGGIDSSKDAGKLMISVLSAVAEIERENIRTQTMAGREQKAKEGKWNGGFAPYGYKLENGNLLIAEDEVEIIRIIYDRYIHNNSGINGAAGKLSFYLSAVDREVKSPNDNPTIGLLLCKDKDKMVAEYALKDVNKPMGVSEYKLSNHVSEELQDKLPSIEDIELSNKSLAE